MGKRPTTLSMAIVVVGGGLGWLTACSDVTIAFDPASPGRGPGELASSQEPLNESFAGGASGEIEPADVEAPTGDENPLCNQACESYCAGLDLPNPVDRGVCRRLWGVGLATRPVVTFEACRRLYADLAGRFPTRSEMVEVCEDQPWGDVVQRLMADDAFVENNQRRWADRLLYNNEAVSIERIYDMDALIGRVYRGSVAYDELAAIVSAHPVLIRRYDTPGDRVEALFSLFLGRPPYENERSDLGRLYALWDNGYYDHARLKQRLPDSTVRYRCVDDEGQVDPGSKGECTSVLWGYHELILEPDFRARNGRMWSGLLTADEWKRLQLPGRLLAKQLGFWERAVDDVLQQYLGYDLGPRVPEARQALVAYVLEHHGDIRAAHYAVATSQVYLQSAAGATPSEHRWTYGPLKQVEVETWIDTVKRTTGYALSNCDHRVSNPEALLSGGFQGRATLEHSNWRMNNGRVVSDYRDLARTLGGCPENLAGGRFKTVSVLTTATQEGFVADVCNPGLEADRGASIGRLLPGDIDADHALTPEVAERIMRTQVHRFFSRGMREVEREQAHAGAEACAPKPCTAEMFARPVCYALLSSSEMLFY